jgi:hypothetical protein
MMYELKKILILLKEMIYARLDKFLYQEKHIGIGAIRNTQVSQI